jgi:hypothetical protein
MLRRRGTSVACIQTTRALLWRGASCHEWLVRVTNGWIARTTAGDRRAANRVARAWPFAPEVRAEGAEGRRSRRKQRLHRLTRRARSTAEDAEDCPPGRPPASEHRSSPSTTSKSLRVRWRDRCAGSAPSSYPRRSPRQAVAVHILCASPAVLSVLCAKLWRGGASSCLGELSARPPASAPALRGGSD